MLPVDQRLFPDTVAQAVQETTAQAALVRSDPAVLATIEGLLALKESGPTCLDHHVVLRSLGGDDAVKRYLERLPNAKALYDLASSIGWKTSPLATLLACGSSAFAGAPAIWGPHLKIISDAVVRAMNGTGPKRIAVAMPYRHGKTALFGFALPMFYLSQRPDHNVGYVSHGSDLARISSRLVRNAIDPARMGFSLAEDQARSDRFTTEAGGALWTGSVSSGLHGFGAGCLICDDPLASAEAAASRTERDKIFEFFISTFLSRGQDDPIIVLTMTRAHSEDLYGALQSGASGTDPSMWNFITMPAIWEGEEQDPLTGRRKGQSLFPAKRPIDELLRFKSGMSPAAWASGFQQTPVDETSINKAYSNFDPAANVRDVKYSRRLPIRVSLDFGVSPMSCVIFQADEVSRDPHHPDFYSSLIQNQKVFEINVLDEISIDDSSTEEMCSEIIERLRPWTSIGRNERLSVVVSGDSSGSQRRSSAGDSKTGVPKSDWDIVRKAFSKASDHFSTRFEVRKSNPSIRDRTNAVNALLKSADGKARLFIHPKCARLIRDLKLVTYAKDSAGNVLSSLSRRDPSLTHISDALGYGVMAVVNRSQVGELAITVL